MGLYYLPKKGKQIKQKYKTIGNNVLLWAYTSHLGKISIPILFLFEKDNSNYDLFL